MSIVELNPLLQALSLQSTFYIYLQPKKYNITFYRPIEQVLAVINLAS